MQIKRKGETESKKEEKNKEKGRKKEEKKERGKGRQRGEGERAPVARRSRAPYPGSPSAFRRGRGLGAFKGF